MSEIASARHSVLIQERRRHVTNAAALANISDIKINCGMRNIEHIKRDCDASDSASNAAINSIQINDLA